MAKRRIDALMVERGLAETRARAQALLMAGKVSVNDRPVTKAGALVPGDARIKVREPLPYVGRGGFKLAHALHHFGLDVSSAVALDVGASTGGFTDCLLQRGATRVYAVDVGRAQLDQRLRDDPRVVVMEKVNARYPIPLPEPVDIAVVDVSFISATRVLPSVVAVLKPEGRAIVLLKPQFEARREEVGKGGVIKDPQTHAMVLARFFAWAVDHGLRIRGLVQSPIAGAEGNAEFLVLLTPAAGGQEGGTE